MPKQVLDPLFQLIKSMTKSEKRNFKIYTNRISNQKETKFIQVFDILDKLDEYKEEIIFKRSKDIKSSQLSNLKAHLYKQILISLRLSQINHDINISIREQIDYAKVLYNKGLYAQSLKILDRIKKQTRKSKQDLLLFEIIEFEKLIESQYITQSIETRAEKLISESTEISKIMDGSVYYSNMSLSLYSLYLKVGYARNEKDFMIVTEFFKTKLRPYKESDLSFFEKVHLYQSHVWYYLIIQDFLMFYKFSNKWVEVFLNEPEMINIKTDLYIKGLNSLLASLFYTNHLKKFKTNLKLLKDLYINQAPISSTNNRVLIEMFYHIHNINKHFMQGTFKEACAGIGNIETFLSINKFSLGKHRTIIFYYKIACLYFGNQEYKKAIVYLNKIQNIKDTSLRSDIHCFARILNLLSHYELEHTDLLDYQIRSTYRFLSKKNDLQKTQKYILSFIRKLSHLQADQIHDELIKSKKILQEWENDPFEKRAFLYLDLIAYIDSKIYKKPIQEIIKQKIKK